MGEQTETQTGQIQSQIVTLTLCHTQTSSSSPSSPSPPRPPPPPPRKSRKLSSNSSPLNSSTANTTATTSQPIKSLSCAGEIDTAIRHLRNFDPKLVPIVGAHDPPVFNNFDAPFLALAKSILYQQITHKAGTAIYNRFVSLCGGEARVCPISVLALTPPQLLQIGVSSRKVGFLHDLANKYRTGILSDSKIVRMDDKALVSLITMVKGFGALAVQMFLIFTLHRPDVLPINDVNVRKGVQIVYGLEQLPRPSQMEALCEHWRPYRSVASWYMWRFVEENGRVVLPKPKQSQQQDVLVLEDRKSPPR